MEHFLQRQTTCTHSYFMARARWHFSRSKKPFSIHFIENISLVRLAESSLLWDYFKCSLHAYRWSVSWVGDEISISWEESGFVAFFLLISITKAYSPDSNLSYLSQWVAQHGIMRDEAMNIGPFDDVTQYVCFYMWSRYSVTQIQKKQVKREKVMVGKSRKVQVQREESSLVAVTMLQRILV